MKKATFFTLALSVFVSNIIGVVLPHRSPAWAGQWYESSPQLLKKQVEDFLAKARPKISLSKTELPLAIIVPHAGYSFSGKTAAAAYSYLRGGSWKRVLILGPSHHANFHGASIAQVEAFDTPLGSVYLDRKACDALIKKQLFIIYPEAHDREHDIECQLPFIQVILPKAQIIPVIIGNITLSEIDSLAQSIVPLLDNKTMLVISTDFTHYGPDFGFQPFTKDVPQHLKGLNMEAANAIASLNSNRFINHVEKTQDTICGYYPILVGLKTLSILSQKKQVKGHLVDYTTSGEITGDWRHCVSYLSLLFTDPPLSKNILSADENEVGHVSSEFSLNRIEKETLLKLARKTVTQYLSKQEMLNDSQMDLTLTNNLRTPCGAFVTLTRKGQLRGCIGYVIPVEPLYKAVMEMAVNAAVHDSRFYPVKLEELKDIRIEISVLSPLKVCSDIRTILVGKHGLMIRKDGYSGLLLPQVATEWGWDRTQFLEQVCVKAGLPASAYKEKDAIIYTFSAEVFHEVQ